MACVYVHILWFGSWIAFGVEGYPYGLLTMIVSTQILELTKAVHAFAAERSRETRPASS